MTTINTVKNISFTALMIAFTVAILCIQCFDTSIRKSIQSVPTSPIGFSTDSGTLDTTEN